MPSSPHVPSTATNVTKDLTVNSLVKVSDDEEMPAPPGALSATLAKMQAKEEALQYHANVKITVLSVVAERLDSTVLRQAASAGQTLNYTKDLINNIKDLFTELRDHPALQDILVSEGVTQPEEVWENKEGEDVKAPLSLPSNPVDSTICQTLVALYKITTNTEKWRSDFKAIP